MMSMMIGFIVPACNQWLRGSKKPVGIPPSSVSQRRMLRSAYRAHIHSLGTDPSQEWTDVLGLAMLPDGKIMLSGTQGRARGSTILRLWDVEAKRCIRSFVGHSVCADTVSFSAGCIISQAWQENNLRIWDLDNGTCRHSVVLEPGVRKHTASNEEVFVPNIGEEDGAIVAVNIHSGVIRSSPRQSWCTDNMDVELHLCGDLLLAAVPHDARDYEAYENEERKSARKAGLYIFDHSSLELVKHIAGKYRCINSAANGDVVAERADGRFDVFRLDDHRLVFRTYFQRRLSQSNQDYCSILLVHNSRAYINPDQRWNREGSAPCTEVHNILTGDLERALWYPPRSLDGGRFASCLVAGKKELFVGSLQANAVVSLTLLQPSRCIFLSDGNISNLQVPTENVKRKKEAATTMPSFRKAGLLPNSAAHPKLLLAILSLSQP